MESSSSLPSLDVKHLAQVARDGGIIRFDGISSRMCRHHWRQTSVEATCRHRSSLSNST
jgi:hypothetical protein